MNHTDALAELIGRLTPALADPDTNPELLYYLGIAALATGDDRLALDALGRSAAAGFGGAYGDLAEALRRLDRPEEALTAALRGLEFSPSDFKALGLVVAALLERGEPERVWSLCEELRARGGWGAHLPSAMALAATTPERCAQVAAVLDESQWLAAAELPVPGDFNRALAAELLEHSSLAALPSTKATTGAGTRIDQLEFAGGPLAQDLLARIRAAVDGYVAERHADADHPMTERRPATVTLNAWALAVHHDGHERWHMHPSGWLSGVYYVHVPQVDTSRGGHPGDIEFGPFPFGADRATAAWPRRFVTPRTGMLLLFPSYFGHRTWPTGVTEPRICVAFDVVAAKPHEPHEPHELHEPQ